MEGKQKLSNYKVGSLPTLMYIPDFITDHEQTSLLNNVSYHIQILTILLNESEAIDLFKIGSLPVSRFTEPLHWSGSHWRIEGYRIGVGLNSYFILISYFIEYTKCRPGDSLESEKTMRSPYSLKIGRD